jgi:hypothetical protein
MTTNEIWTLGIAGYAAIVSTFVLGWDAYKWFHAGPQVQLTASTGMKIVGNGMLDPNTYVSATAVNLGDRATTITNLGFTYYESWFKAYLRRNRPSKAFIITSPSQAQSLPYRFEVGAQWMGLANQGEDVKQMIREGYLFVVLYHAHGGVRYQLRLNELAQVDGDE